MRRRVMNGKKNYLRFTAINGTSSVMFKIDEEVGTDVFSWVEYSLDEGSTWTRTLNVDNEEVSVTTPSFSGSVLFRGSGTAMATNFGESRFYLGYVDVSGNVMSMLFADDFEGKTTLPGKYAFKGLFTSNYNSTFSNILLPATTLTEECYGDMFSGTEITTAPVLPATNLAAFCYSGMFTNCRYLTTAPALPATTLKTACYMEMFYGCRGLTTAPVLPAKNLVSSCYNYMFSGCSILNYIKAMFTTKPDNSYTWNWVDGVSATGTFVKNSAATWNVSGADGIPSGWTVQTASS